jgi:hypothetical protein
MVKEARRRRRPFNESEKKCRARWDIKDIVGSSSMVD